MINKDSDTTNTGQTQQEQKNQKQLNKKPCCQCCGKEFKGFEGNSGKKYSAEYEYNKRKEKYGQALCNDCIEKRGLKNE